MSAINILAPLNTSIYIMFFLQNDYFLPFMSLPKSTL